MNDHHEIPLRVARSHRFLVGLRTASRGRDLWAILLMTSGVPIAGYVLDLQYLVRVGAGLVALMIVMTIVSVVLASRSDLQMYPTEGTLRISASSIDIDAPDQVASFERGFVEFRRRAGGYDAATPSGYAIAAIPGWPLNRYQRDLLEQCVESRESARRVMPTVDLGDMPVQASVALSPEELCSGLRSWLRHSPSAYFFGAFMVISIAMAGLAALHGLTVLAAFMLANGIFLYVHCGPDMIVRGPRSVVRRGDVWPVPLRLGVDEAGLMIVYPGASERLGWRWVRWVDQSDDATIVMLPRLNLYIPHGSLVRGTQDEFRELISANVSPVRSTLPRPAVEQ